ncbi:hypothetical protein [Chitinophaga sp. Cy-1792]|uniref:hypothetical protein n=1 Tax=Chitinophaga sp. Cy-1792 TaxID=2608339 RepID=UPI0014221C06|nr:hypothetical protein [Chitinophaga sp. Cy-1792]NIG57049.1 hypothetical protein [Chitinophaga sp. Cy-1792]
MRHILLFVSLLLCAAACKQPGPRVVTPAFYFWKQAWTNDSSELHYLRELPAQRLYIKMFDVSPDEVSGAPVPVAIFQQQAPLPEKTEVVPVIFLMNTIWDKTQDSSAINLLATKTASLLENLCKHLPEKIPEIQIDCDWTKTSKDKYFQYLRYLQLQPFFHGKKVSATIRMHQVKFVTGSGIPPVDKGLLMCYNMGDLRKPGDHNSILDLATLQSYIGKDRISEYPLTLDIALPLFEWTVYFQQNAYKGILRNIGTAELQDKSLFLPQGKQLFIVKKDTLYNGYLLRKGDELRRETTSPELLESAAALISRQRQDYDPVVVFYHLDAVTLQKFPLNELQKIYRLFN